MPAKQKIVGELEHKIRILCEKGYNPRYISTQVDNIVSKDTIKKWAVKNGYKLASRTSSKIIDINNDIRIALLSGLNRKQVQKKFKVSFEVVRRLALEEKIPIRSRSEASLDKILNNDEASFKLPPNNGKVIGYSQKKKKYIVQADDGFIYYKSSGKLFQGDPRNKNGTRLDIENVKKQLDMLGYEYLDSWTIKREPLRAKCKKCNQIRKNRLKNFYFQGCPTCLNTGTSRAEVEILEWIREFYPSACKFYLPNNITKPKEIDIYIPELKLGIEYCGLHWHSEQLDADKVLDNKHYKKMLMAEKEGIRLITIFENEWKERKDQVQGFLLSALNKNSNKIFARECEIVELESEEAGLFFEENHIQGKPSISLVVYGLKHRGMLVGAMDVGNHPRKSSRDGDKIYLNRLAFKKDTTVVGGATRLFSAVKKYAKQNKYKEIISWSDNRWSQGNIYRVLGFDFSSQKEKGRGLADGSIWPDFSYVFKGKLYSRVGVKKLNIHNYEDLPKIYDCGKKRWIYSLEP